MFRIGHGSAAAAKTPLDDINGRALGEQDSLPQVMLPNHKTRHARVLKSGD
jgi:hypothetical protein